MDYGFITLGILLSRWKRVCIAHNNYELLINLQATLLYTAH